MMSHLFLFFPLTGCVFSFFSVLFSFLACVCVCVFLFIVATRETPSIRVTSLLGNTWIYNTILKTGEATIMIDVRWSWPNPYLNQNRSVAVSARVPSSLLPKVTAGRPPKEWWLPPPPPPPLEKKKTESRGWPYIEILQGFTWDSLHLAPRKWCKISPSTCHAPACQAAPAVPHVVYAQAASFLKPRYNDRGKYQARKATVATGSKPLLFFELAPVVPCMHGPAVSLPSWSAVLHASAGFLHTRKPRFYRDSESLTQTTVSGMEQRVFVFGTNQCA